MKGTARTGNNCSFSFLVQELVVIKQTFRKYLQNKERVAPLQKALPNPRNAKKTLMQKTGQKNKHGWENKQRVNKFHPQLSSTQPAYQAEALEQPEAGRGYLPGGPTACPTLQDLTEPLCLCHTDPRSSFHALLNLLAKEASRGKQGFLADRRVAKSRQCLSALLILSSRLRLIKLN